MNLSFEFKPNLGRLITMYTEANSQRNTDFGVLFLKIFVMDNTFRQYLKFDCAEKMVTTCVIQLSIGCHKWKVTLFADAILLQI